MNKQIEIEFCEEQIEVTVDIFNDDNEVFFDIESAKKDGVDILHVIECLGGFGALCEVVEQALKGGQ